MMNLKRGTPYIGYSNDTLDEQDDLEIGEEIVCPRCGEVHVIEGGKNMETGEEDGLLLFYVCDDVPRLAGVVGKSIMDLERPDASGKL